MSNYVELDNVKNTFEGTKVIDSYALSEINLITPVQTFSLKTMIIEISYFEDIFNCSTSGHILIRDSISLIEGLKLCGNEYIKLVFNKNESINNKAEFYRYFRVYRVGERTLENNNTEMYTLHFCSEELFLSEQMRVLKSYKNKQISEIIKDILKNYLKIPEKRINVDDSDGLYDLIVPNKKPFEAINWLINVAQPLGKEGADYLFYENQDGFNFLSLQKLYEKVPYSEYSYNPNNAGLFNKTTELTRSFNNIKSYKYLDTFDSLYAVSGGVLANKVRVVNTLTQDYKDVTFDYTKYFNSTNTLNNSPIIGSIENRLGKKPNENYDGVFKTVNSNFRVKFAEWYKNDPSGVGNDIMAEVFIPFRTAQIKLASYSRVRLLVTGDPQLSVGKIIEVNLPSNISKDGTKKENKSEKSLFNSGKYLIIGVRHVIDINLKYETILEVAKDSFSSDFPSTETNPDFAAAKRGEK